MKTTYDITDNYTCIMYINDEPFLCFSEDKDLYDSMCNYMLPYQKGSRFTIPEETGKIVFKFLEIRDFLYNGFFKINCEMER